MHCLFCVILFCYGMAVLPGIQPGQPWVVIFLHKCRLEIVISGFYYAQGCAGKSAALLHTPVQMQKLRGVFRHTQPPKTTDTHSNIPRVFPFLIF